MTEPSARTLLDQAVSAETDPSGPKVGKFQKARELIAQFVGLEPSVVPTYYVSKPGNLTVRFGQPGSGGPLGVGVLAPLEQKPGE